MLISAGSSPQSVPVVHYSGEQFQDITRSPQVAAAACDGIIRVPMKGAGGKGDDLDRVLAHEFTHALIRSLARRGLPTWLNAGLASVFESDSRGSATSRFEDAFLHRVQKSLADFEASLNQ